VACANIITPSGEEARVGYGTGRMVRDPDSGRYRRTRMFALILRYSRKDLRLLTFESSTRIWQNSTSKLFRRLGGVTRTVVLDNLGEGVLKPDIYGPQTGPSRHASALWCRHPAVQRPGPERQGPKVERGVGHAKQAPLKGLRFEGLANARDCLDRRRVLGRHP
jgi:hypothetical protein